MITSSLPRDPQALLNLIYERTKRIGKSRESEAFVTIADGLRTGIVPADPRAALYKAAALIPGVTVTDREATIDGRRGIALGIPASDGVARTGHPYRPRFGFGYGRTVIPGS